MDQHPEDIEFFPSTVEHRPLHAPEKVMLKRHFEEDGSRDLGVFDHWEKSEGEALRLLEAWVWGMRYWGRETLFRIAWVAYRLCQSRWKVGDEGAGADTNVKTVKMGSGRSLSEVLEACMRWAVLPGEKIAYEIMQLREGERPEEWIAREVPPEDQESVFAWTLIASDRMSATILVPRDEAACQAAQALVCGARALMATGLDEEAAVRETRAYTIKEMRAWMGRKW